VAPSISAELVHSPDRVVVWRPAPQAILVAAIVFAVFLGLRTDWIPHQPNCDLPCHPLPGETLIGIEAAERLLSEGSRYWFLQQVAEGGDVKIYTHNVNIDAYIQYPIRLAGVKSHVPLALVNAASFFIGVWLGYVVVLRATKDPFTALLFLFFFATTYYFNLLFVFNLRAWHWLGLFGVLTCTLLMNGDERDRKRGEVWIFPAAFVAFANSYDFAAEVAAAALALAVLYRNLHSAGFVLAAFASAFAIRQVQVIGAVGVETWATDLWYTALIKTGFLANLFGKPDIAQIQAWYDEHAILRYPAVPGMMSLVDHGKLFGALFSEYWMPYFGMALMPSLLGFFCYRHPAWRFLVATTIGIAAGLLFFSPYSIHFAVKHAVPLLLFPFCVSTAILASSAVSIKKIGRLLLFAVIAIHVAVQARNWYSFPLSDQPFPVWSTIGR